MKLKGQYQQAGTGMRTIQLASITVVSALFFMLLAGLITGNDLSGIGALKTAQFFQSVGLFIVPPVLLAFLWSKSPWRQLKVSRPPKASAASFAVVIMVVAVPAVNLLGAINHAIQFPASLSFIEQYLIAMESRAEVFTQQILTVDSIPDLLINIGLVAIVPAIGEELFFRGTVQRLLEDKMKVHAAIWITAFIFSSIHFQFYGFIPRLLMGALLGYLLVWTNNLWVPILAHFTTNAMAVVFYYLKHTEKTTLDLDSVGNLETYLVGVISLVVVAMLIYFFRPKRSMSSET